MMTLAHLLGYFIFLLAAVALFGVCFTDIFVRSWSWVKKMHQLKQKWGNLHIDFGKLAALSPTNGSQGFQPSKLRTFCSLAVSQVFSDSDLTKLSDGQRDTTIQATGNVIGAVVFPDSRLEEFVNEVRIYMTFFLLLFLYNVLTLIGPEVTDLLASPIMDALNRIAQLVGSSPSKVIAWKELIVLAILCTRMYGERMSFLHYVR